MTWKILRDLNDLIKEEPHREEIKISDIERFQAKRYKKEVYRRMIYNYLRKNKKGIWELSAEDIGQITAGFNSLDVSIFMDEVKHCLEVNWWKPIKRIIANNKSVLFDKK